METAATAAFTSWTLDWNAVTLLLAALIIYSRGWRQGRKLIRHQHDLAHLGSFLAGLGVVFFALASPLDSFDSLFLSAHMAQHLLMMMLAPPLLLLGKPFLPLLRGLPKPFVKEGLGPFLAWPLFKSAGAFLTSPVVAWFIFAFTTVLWHLPYFYELALHSSTWHGIQHACFFWSGILFWWPILENCSKRPSWVFIPYLLLADIVNTALSAYFVFSGRLLYPTYGLMRASALKATDDQILAGLIMWVPGSIIYLVPAFLLAMQVFAGKHTSKQQTFERVRERHLSSASRLAFFARHRRWPQAALLLLSVAVMADGWFGQQVTPVNLAGTLPWIYWRALSLLALLTIGNLFCMACPFVLVRDIARKAFWAKLRWPRALRNKWLAAALFILYLWAYEAYGLWDSPWLTAWIIAGYFLAALLVDGLFKGASFCKYVCPIGQFHFVVSTLSPHEIAMKQPAVCQSCKTFDCIKGNAAHKGCELDLFVPKKVGNLDCTICLDCVNACPHGNVALVNVMPAQTLVVDVYRSSIGRLTKRFDWIAMMLLVTFGAFANAAAMTSPVMLWEHRWPYSMPLLTAAFLLAGVVILPVLLVCLCGLLSTGLTTLEAIRKFAIVPVPLGIGMWAAHIAYHALGNLLADSTPLEILFLNAGVLFTLYLIWQAAQGSLRLAAPWATLALAMYATGLWILFQPMQMRGMM